MAQYCTFLGANTPSGFFSVFDELYNPYKNRHAYLIKGGPGTGKSTFMKKVAAAAQKKGFETELALCSSDPKSLDGLIVPELSFCIADATAPHIIEPTFPGASENIINTGSFWNKKELFERADEIRALTIENSLYHRRSAGFLSAAGCVVEDTQRLFSQSIDSAKIASFAVRFAARETPKKKSGKPGKKMRRFISAISPDGLVFLDKTVTALSSRIIAICDEHGAVSGMVTQRIGEFAVRNGYDVIFCLCPMKPRDFCEHIIIPEVGLSVITKKSAHRTKLAFDRSIHAERFLEKDFLKNHKNRLNFNEKLTAELTGESIALLKKAHQVHDELEKIYIGAMDMQKLNEFTEQFIKETVINR
ncbi:MAG: hypothetical protein ACI4W6_05340 [Acutalibacteraceae bacterium]